MPEPTRDYQAIRRRVQIEASTWGTLTSLHNAFINPLLIARGAGPLALGLFSSGASLFGLGSAYLGPRLAAHAGSVGRVAVTSLLAARLVFLGLPLTLALTDDGAVPLLIAIVVLWVAGEGVASPLWQSYLAGLVGPAERGRWLAMRATVAAGTAACILVVTLGLLQVLSRDLSFQLAYAVAAAAGLGSVLQLRLLFRMTPAPTVPAARSVRGLPAGRPARRFLGGVFLFWFGVGLVAPVITPYIINELDAPTAYFAAVAVLAALTGVVVQRQWGRYGDTYGARAVLGLAGIGVGAVPILWAMVPVYWIGTLVEVIASGCWPGHLLGLTLRAIELAEDEAERPALIAWTNLAQGAGASIGPLVASALVGPVGTIPILVAAGTIRLGASVIIGRPSWSAFRWRRGRERAAP